VAATADSLISLAPLGAAQEISDYPQFAPCEIPPGSAAARAYKGFIRPFSDDATARRVHQAFENDLPVQVFGGRVDAYPPNPSQHKFDNLLMNMALPCSILILEFPGKAHPQAYLLDPPMKPRLSLNRHLRHDKSIKIDGVTYPALCVYSGTLQQFEPDRSRLDQFLDQVATYLAKHLIWLRTRRIHRQTVNGSELARPKLPSEPVLAAELNRSRDLFCVGHWPGKSAPSGPMAHLATIKPDDECWCWSGDKYGECCRPREFTEMTEWQDRMIRVRFVDRLMTAVRAKL
jgi:hypothetical protein